MLSSFGERRAGLIVLCAIALLGSCTQVVAAARIDLDRDWMFRTDPDSIGQRSEWQSHTPSQVLSVNLPHTWNLGRQDGYLGKAWYCKTFALPLQSPDLHVKLHFGATFYFARVWLNGIELGTHEGGYTAYSFDVTHQLRANKYLAVEVDNRIDATTIPGLAQRGDPDAWYDWWDYGGIVRDVWLTMSGPIEVNRQQIRAQMKAGQASINDLIVLENHFSRQRQFLLSITAFGPDGKTAAHQSRRVDVAPGITGSSCSFSVNVTGVTSGMLKNTTGAVTSNEGGQGGTATATLIVAGRSQQPPEPIDLTPISSQAYYVLDQLNGLQADLNNGSDIAGDHVVQEPRSFTNTSQRWIFTKSGSAWQISNVSNSLCFDSASISGVTYVVQNPCGSAASQQWFLSATANGYYTIQNSSTG